MFLVLVFLTNGDSYKHLCLHMLFKIQGKSSHEASTGIQLQRFEILSVNKDASVSVKKSEM